VSDAETESREGETYLQADQPEGVPPLELTGERTLPDVPEENYWYRRHLAVYEWIAERMGGRKVVDLACGEGYGSDLLARSAAAVIGVDANPEAYEHARLRYWRPNLEFRRELVEDFHDPVDAVVFLQTIEHIHEPEKLLAHFAEIAPVSYVSTPNRITLAGPDAEKSENPWHLKEYDIGEYRELLEPHFSQVEILGVFHARKLRAQEIALKLGWDRVHRGLHITKPFYDRFVPAIRSTDFRLGAGGKLDRALDFVAVCHV
jgi:SAM-dependent methyltransferase